MRENEELKGLGGWLVLVGIGVILSPVRLLLTILPTFIPIFQDGTWEALTSVGSVSYHQLWAPLLIGEIIYNALMLGASLVLIFLYFRKHYFFPKLYIIIMVSSTVFVLIDSWAVTRVLPEIPVFDSETTMEFVRSLAATLIWVPYMLISRRVKATFINSLQMPEN